MKLTIQRETTLSQLNPGEGIWHDEKRWVVDEVRRTQAGYTVFCVIDAGATSRRKSFEFKGDDTVVLVEPIATVSRAILATLVEVLEHGIESTGSKQVVLKKHSDAVVLEIDTSAAESDGEVWQLVLEP